MDAKCCQEKDVCIVFLFMGPGVTCCISLEKPARECRVRTRDGAASMTWDNSRASTALFTVDGNKCDLSPDVLKKFFFHIQMNI